MASIAARPFLLAAATAAAAADNVIIEFLGTIVKGSLCAGAVNECTFISAVNRRAISLSPISLSLISRKHN